MSAILSEAFQKLNILNEEDFNLNDTEDVKEAKGFMDSFDDEVNDDVVVTDLEAKSEDELLDSYIGKVILDCCVCHSKIFENPENVILDETGEVANMDVECPYCFSNDGYKVVGKVIAMDDIDLGDDDEDDIEVDIEEKEETDESLKEGVFDKLKFKKIGVSQLSKGNKVYLEPEKDSYEGTVDSVGKDSSGMSDLVINYTDRKPVGYDSGDYVYVLKESKEKVNTIEEGIFDKFKFKKVKINQLSQGDKVYLEPKENEYEGTVKSTEKDSSGMHDIVVNYADRKPVGYDSNDFVYVIKGKDVKESLNEAADTKYLVKVIMHTMEGDFTWYYGKDSKMLASDDPDQYKELKLSDVKKYGYDTKEDAMNSESYLNVKNNSRIPSFANIIAVSVGTSEVKESLNEAANINEYQKWVDYDMEKYHKISGNTMNKIKKAGFSVVKDQYGDYEVIADRKDNSRRARRNRQETDEACSTKNEALEKVELDTEDQHITISAEDKYNEEEIELNSEQTIGEISDDEKADIESHEDEDEEDKFVDVDVKEFDEESFDNLGESFLKKVYENVDSFKTSKVAGNDKKIVVEGTITFSSGNKKNTRFIFEAKSISKTGKMRFSGMNEQLSNGKKSFLLNGKLKGKTFIAESMSYNYTHKLQESTGESQKVVGTVSNKKLTEKKDLSSVKGSMTNLLQDYVGKMEGKDKDAIVNDVEQIFADNNLDTPATKKMLAKLRNAKSDKDAMFIITSSVLYGSDLGVA